jgi:long-subunit acyl-CoA synthetase (AMP-forming)
MTMPTIPFEGSTLNDMFQDTVAREGDAPALIDGDRVVTWSEYGSRVRAIAMRLSTVGVGRGDHVALMMGNIPEFDILDTAAMHVGAVPFSLPEVDPVARLTGAIDTASATAIVATAAATPRALEVAAAASSRPVVITLGDEVPGAMSLAALESAAVPAGTDFDELLKRVDPEDDATILFTSGTTGAPKAVRLSHRAIVLSERNQSTTAPIGSRPRVLSYLPVSHITERFMAHYLTMCFGGELHDVPDHRTLYDDLARIRPSRFTSLPRTWEKLHDRAIEQIQRDPALRSVHVAALEVVRAEQAGEILTAAQLQQREYAAALLAPVRDLLGLSAAENLVTCGGPISPALLESLAAMGIPVCNIWGMSEVINVVENPPERLRFSALGKALPGLDIRIAPDGEILVRGVSASSGYLNDPVRTAELFDEGGWVHTGDLGSLDDEGYLTIIGRKKDQLVTATGLNVSPAVIETALRDSSTLVDQAMVVAEGRRFVTAVLALDEIALRAVADRAGLSGTFAELARAQPVLDAVSEAIASANSRLDFAETVRGWVVADNPWEPGGAEMTETGKLRREWIADAWADEIARLYA